MTAPVGKPADPMAIRSGSGDALVKDIVLMLEDRNLWFFQLIQELMLSDIVACCIVEPLQLAHVVLGPGQTAITVIRKCLNLPLLAATACGLALDESPHGVVLEVCGPVTVHAARGQVAAMVVEIVGSWPSESQWSLRITCLCVEVFKELRRAIAVGTPARYLLRLYVYLFSTLKRRGLPFESLRKLQRLCLMALS